MYSQDDPKISFSNIIAVTNRRLCPVPLPVQAEKICRFRPRALILREKDLSEPEYLALAKEILPVCRAFKVPCILHNYPEAAKKLSCKAIHLPFPLFKNLQAENRLSDFSLVGTSVHSVQEAREAEILGASYLSAGHIYATDCKKDLPPRGLPFLRQVCMAVSIPVYGIGGIRLDQAQLDELTACGAAGGCVMSGMMKL